MKSTPKILIVEDHEWARIGLSYALQSKSPFQITGQAANGEEALIFVQQERPDAILMDIGMPLMDGITTTQQIKLRDPALKIIMLTSHQAEEEVYASLSAGADAYCMKDIKIERLIQVIEMVLEGALWFDPAIARLVVKGFSTDTRENNRHPNYVETLTKREQEILALIVKGKSNKEIAQVLEVSTHTVKVHVGNVIQKLAVNDRTQAAVKALQQGLVVTHL